MPSLLIRDISESTKKQLAIQAAENGRSQQAEALAILEESLEPKTTSWFDSLQEASNAVEGVDFPIASRHFPRSTSNDSIHADSVPVDIKEQGRIALQKIGATPTDLINAAYRYVLKEGKLPEAHANPLMDADSPRKLTIAQKRELKERIERTTFPIPDSFWGNKTDDELLEEALEEKYACTH